MFMLLQEVNLSLKEVLTNLFAGQPLNSVEDQNRYPERPYLRPWLSQSGTSFESPREEALQQATLLNQRRFPSSRNLCNASRPCSEKTFKMAPRADSLTGVCRENRMANPHESQMECAERSLSDKVGVMRILFLELFSIMQLAQIMRKCAHAHFPDTVKIYPNYIRSLNVT